MVAHKVQAWVLGHYSCKARDAEGKGVDGRCSVDTKLVGFGVLTRTGPTVPFSVPELLPVK